MIVSSDWIHLMERLDAMMGFVTLMTLGDYLFIGTIDS